MINWDDINLPSGVSKDRMWKDLVSISKTKSAHHARLNKFWFTKEDLEQEIMIKLLKALPKFDPSKAYHEKHILYFSRCADNIVADLKRKYLYYHKVPCKTCPHWDKTKSKRAEHDCNKYLDKLSCDLYERYVSLYKSKYMLGSTYGNYTADKPSMTDGDSASDVSGFMHSTSGTSGTSEYQEDVFEKIDFNDFIEKKLSPEAFNIFQSLLAFNYDCSKLDSSDFRLLRREIGRIYRLGND